MHSYIKRCDEVVVHARVEGGRRFAATATAAAAIV